MEHDEKLILGHESRLTKAESKIMDHDSLLASLTSSLTTLSSDFSAVKNWIIGGVVFWIVHEIGILQFVQGFFTK